jgi:cytochrome c oxidase cbb3-type subunit 1
MFLKIRDVLKKYRNKQNLEDADKLADYISNLSDKEIVNVLEKRKAALDYQLSHTELAGSLRQLMKRVLSIMRGQQAV